jgi:hypothetical protein
MFGILIFILAFGGFRLLRNAPSTLRPAQFLPCNQFSRVLKKGYEDLEGLLLKFDFNALLAEFPAAQIDFE